MHLVLSEQKTPTLPYCPNSHLIYSNAVASGPVLVHYTLVVIYIGKVLKDGLNLPLLNDIYGVSMMSMTYCIYDVYDVRL